MDDRALTQGLKAGEAAAFNRLYDTYRPRIYGFLLRMTGDPECAAELLQETFLRLAKGAGGLREDTRLGPWLFTVARNLAHSRGRRRRRSPLEASGEGETLAHADGPGASPFEVLAQREAAAHLERALLGLPAEQREALLLVAVEGFTAPEAATILGIYPATLRQRLSRARATLRATLALQDSSGGGP